MIELHRLKEQLSYDPGSGRWTWLVRPARNVFPGDEAGCVGSNGCRHINVDGQHYLAHRLAWFYMTGEWPASEIDHRDLDRSNNQWSNLRLACRGENNRNVGRRRDNTSGIKGVRQRGGRFTAAIRCGGEPVHLGSYRTASQAKAAYDLAAYLYHGEFAHFG